MKKVLDVALQTMFDTTEDMIFVKDANLVYVAASMPFVKMVGKTKTEEILNRTDLEIFEDRDLAERYIADDRKLIAGGQDLINYIEPITDDNGRARYGTTSKHILRDETGEVVGILGVTKDTTGSYIARLNYQRELRYLFELPPDMYAVSYIDVDDWRVVSHRRQMIGNSSIQLYHTVDGLCEAATQSIVDKESVAAEFYRNFTPNVLRKLYAENEEIKFQYQRQMTDGELHWVQNEVKFLVDMESGHLCVMLTVKDIDEEKQTEQDLIIAASVDMMTRVLNRATTMDAIQQILEKESEQRHVLFMFDLDNFKQLNDTLGHQMGDSLLIAFSSELRGKFRGTDIVGRVGGDEFFALMRNVSDVLEVKAKAEDILRMIRTLSVDGKPFRVTGSIGVSVFPEDGKSLEQLYAKADEALYRAKENGKNKFVLAGEM